MQIQKFLKTKPPGRKPNGCTGKIISECRWRGKGGEGIIGKAKAK
jgi:hypothetical protein